MFDTQRLWDKAWRQAGEACGVAMGEAQIAPLRGRSLADSRAIFEKNVAPGEVFDRCNAMANALVREWLRGEVPMKPGLLQLLAYLQRTGRVMAVVSSTCLLYTSSPGFVCLQGTACTKTVGISTKFCARMKYIRAQTHKILEK